LLYLFENFTLDTDRRELHRGSVRLGVEPQVFDVLQHLIRNRERVVSKDELLAQVWHGRIVSEATLSSRINAARSAVGDNGEQQRLIRTVARKGFRFVGAAREEQRGAPAIELTQVEAPDGSVEQPAAAITAAEPPSGTGIEGGGERRQVTVLSCELIGSAAGYMDPEDLRDLTDAYHRWVAETVSRFGGFVGRRAGTMIVVFFGYPAADEDDAEQAVRAGLQLCTAVGAKPGAGQARQRRVGIATGLVVVRDCSGAMSDAETVGEPLSTAARLLVLAPPDAVLIDEGTKRLIGNTFDCRDLGAIDATRTNAPGARAWQVLAPSMAEGRFEALHAGSLTPLVGREEELEILLRRWKRAKAGEGRVVQISGEPGIGKSRLAQALSEALQAEPHTRLRYFCSPRHTDSALFPFIGQLERSSRFERDDSPAQKRGKLQTLLAQSAADAESVAVLADLLSLPGDERRALPELTPQKRKEKTLAALLAQLQGLAARQPVLVIFEDLHWIDPTSLELLQFTVERIRALPVLLVTTFRPEFQSPWTGQPNATVLSLSRLGARDGSAVVQQVAGDKILPSRIIDEIVERTDGVPLFLEELTKAILESGAEAEKTISAVASAPITLPATLHASLMARLDRLGPVKQVAQIGAAIGREFSYELIAALAPLNEVGLASALDRLVESGLVFRRGAVPQATYLFKHVLVRDAAYGTLLREPRRELHARIAKVLTEKFPESTKTQPEILAHHYTQAGLMAQASEFWGKAGQKSIARSALTEAVAQLTKALEQIDSVPGTPVLRAEQIKLQLALANVLMHVKGYTSPEAPAAFEAAGAMLDRAESMGEHPADPLLRFSVIYGQWAAHYVGANLHVLLPLSEEFLAYADKGAATGPLLVANRLMGVSHLMLGSFDSARAYLDKAVALYAPEEHRPLAARFGQDVGCMALAYRSITLWVLGYPEAALKDADNLLNNAREVGQAGTTMYTLFHVSFPEILAGRVAAARMHAEELIALAADKGASQWHAWGLIIRGWTSSVASQAAEAIQSLRGGTEACMSRGGRVFNPIFFAALSHAHMQCGEFHEASVCIWQALSEIEETNERWAEAEVHRAAGELALAGVDRNLEQAERSFQRSLVIARSQQAKSWELRTATSLARLWRDQGRCDEARDLLGPVYGWFTEGYDTPDLQEARALLAESNSAGRSTAELRIG